MSDSASTPSRPNPRRRWWSSRPRGQVPGELGAGPVDAVAPGERALAAFAALDAAFGANRSPSLFTESTGRAGRRYAYLWPFSRVAAAALDLAELGSVPVDRAAGILGEGLACYLRHDGVLPAYDSAVRPPLGPGGDRFYDDNAWVGLDLVRLHQLSGDAAPLERAVAVFAFLVSGWDDDPDRPHPGGIAWVESPTNHDRNTVSTAPAAQLGYLLDGLGLGAGTGGTREWADRMAAWVHDTLRDPVDGLYWDHIDDRGAIEPTKWSYNQGNVIGVELARHRLPGGADGPAAGRSLARAEAVAVAALDHYASLPGGLAGQGLAFDAIFFRNLLDLRRVTGGALGDRIRDTVVGFADEVWRTRCGPDALVRAGRRGAPVPLIDQAAMVELQALAALALVDGVR